MRFNKRVLTLIAVAFLGSALSARADTYTYSYTGNPYTNGTVISYDLNGTPTIYSTYSLSPNSEPSITGYFTRSTPLGDNLPLSNPLQDPGYPPGYGPLTYFFSDGYAEFESGASSFSVIEVATDSMGNITQWMISGAPYDDYALVLTTEDTSGVVEDEESFGRYYVTTVYNTNDPGTWTESINGVPVSNSPVPEPSSLVLLATGTLALAGAARRRLLVFLNVKLPPV